MALTACAAPMPALHQAALSAGLYPGFAYVLTRLHTLMRRAEELLLHEYGVAVPDQWEQTA